MTPTPAPAVPCETDLMELEHWIDASLCSEHKLYRVARAVLDLAWGRVAPRPPFPDSRAARVARGFARAQRRSLLFEPGAERTCRICGRTELCVGPGPFFWEAATLCSRCARAVAAMARAWGAA